MHGSLCVARGAAAVLGFNSLFEMRQRPRHQVRQVELGVGLVSILYLRCPPPSPGQENNSRHGCFNSLFEMQGLFWAPFCGGATPRLFQFSI